MIRPLAPGRCEDVIPIEPRPFPGRRPIRLAEPEIRRSLGCLREAFPHFSGWDYRNDSDESYPGFSVWGKFVAEPGERDPRRLFVTLVAESATWKGYLTIGQPSDYWSSCDVDDAYLVDTDPCSTLEDTITSLKRRIKDLFAALTSQAAEPCTAPGRDE